MERQVEDAGVVPEDVLRPVPVVDVPVENRHPLEPVLRLRRPGRDRGVVEEAEAHRAVGRRVMAGRPDECEPADPGRLDRRARGEQRRLEAGRRGGRVAVQPRLGVDRADARDVLGRVAALDLLDRRRPAIAPRLDRVEQNLQPPRRLRMVARRVQPRQRGVAHHLHQPAASASSLPARLPRPHDSASEDASAHRGAWSAREGRGAEASIVAIRR